MLSSNHNRVGTHGGVSNNHNFIESRSTHTSPKLQMNSASHNQLS